MQSRLHLQSTCCDFTRLLLFSVLRVDLLDAVNGGLRVDQLEAMD